MIRWPYACVAVLICCGTAHGGQRDLVGELSAIQDETQRIAYVRALTTNEVWLLANEVRDKQGHWQSYGAAVILSYYFGEDWERHTPQPADFSRVVNNTNLNPELRGSLAASGFELGRRWKIEDQLQYFDLASRLITGADIPTREKSQIAEYSYRAFARCLSEVRGLSGSNAVQSQLLDHCHSNAQAMMSVLAAVVNQAPQERTTAPMAKVLEDYVAVYERGDLPESPELHQAVNEAAKSRSVLQRVRGK